jgi:hypothetical protein
MKKERDASQEQKLRSTFTDLYTLGMLVFHHCAVKMKTPKMSVQDARQDIGLLEIVCKQVTIATSSAKHSNTIDACLQRMVVNVVMCVVPWGEDAVALNSSVCAAFAARCPVSWMRVQLDRSAAVVVVEAIGPNLPSVGKTSRPDNAN